MAPGGNLYTSNDVDVGDTGAGNFVQSGGSNSLGNDLYLGYSLGSSGSYNLSGGLLIACDQWVGYSGTGSFTQSGGTQTVWYIMKGRTEGIVDVRIQLRQQARCLHLDRRHALHVHGIRR